MKVVVDTNVLVSGIFWSGRPFQVLKHWTDGKFDLLVSEPILDEYIRVIAELGEKRNSHLGEAWGQLVVRNALLIQPNQRCKYSRDKDDDKFLDCSVSGGAQYLVSGDDDLLSLKRVVDVEIMTPTVFLKLF